MLDWVNLPKIVGHPGLSVHLPCRIVDDMRERSATHENAAAFGPCAGPATPEHGESWFCQGYGTERMDPADPFGSGTAILCYPCHSMRESKQIEADVASILERVA